MGPNRAIRRTLLSAIFGIGLLAVSPARGAEPDRGPASHSAAGDADLACAHAPPGTVIPVPPPVDRWAAVVCGPQSQALVPVGDMVWLAHGSNDAVSILALPPGASPVPRSEGYNPGYGVRFKALYAAEATGAKRDRTVAYLKRVLGAAPPPKIGRVIQLDAVSIIYDMRYNIFFYLDGERPILALACLDHCREALLMDVLERRSARARAARK